MQTAEEATASNRHGIAGIQMATAHRAREAAQMEDEVARSHDQLLGAQSVAAAVAATRRE